ncbi:MAG: hypothetical protein QXG35_08835 [Nitrososphaerota archaeon]
MAKDAGGKIAFSEDTSFEIMGLEISSQGFSKRLLGGFRSEAMVRDYVLGEMVEKEVALRQDIR